MNLFPSTDERKFQYLQITGSRILERSRKVIRVGEETLARPDNCVSNHYTGLFRTAPTLYVEDQ